MAEASHHHYAARRIGGGSHRGDNQYRLSQDCSFVGWLSPIVRSLVECCGLELANDGASGTRLYTKNTRAAIDKHARGYDDKTLNRMGSDRIQTANSVTKYALKGARGIRMGLETGCEYIGRNAAKGYDKASQEIKSTDWYREVRGRSWESVHTRC